MGHGGRGHSVAGVRNARNGDERGAARESPEACTGDARTVDRCGYSAGTQPPCLHLAS